MSGFFLFRREALTEPMTPRGFKILFEIAVRHPIWSAAKFHSSSWSERTARPREPFRRLPLPAAACRHALEPVAALTGPPDRPAKLESITLREDLAVRLLTTRNEKFPATAG